MIYDFGSVLLISDHLLTHTPNATNGKGSERSIVGIVESWEPNTARRNLIPLDHQRQCHASRRRQIIAAVATAVVAARPWRLH